MKYIVQEGDTLGKIAQKLLGNPNLYTEILKANPSIKNANLIHIGDEIEIPSVSKTPISKVTSNSSVSSSTMIEKLKTLGSNKAVLIGSALALASLAYVLTNKKRGIV